MRFTLPLRSVQVLVKSATGNPTGITGLLQHPNPRPVLIELYKSTISFLNDKFPEESVYKKSALNLTHQRLNIVEKTEDVKEIEDKIGNGLIEEILIQASEELELAEKMSQWKSWEALEEEPLDDQWVYFGKKI